MHILLELLLFATPVILAGIMHMIIVKFNVLPTLTYPLDHYKTYNNKRIFGANKTYRGLICMVLGSVLSMYIYYNLIHVFPAIKPYNLYNFNLINPFGYGILLGTLYIIAELPNSFFKRQQSIPEGKNNGWLPKLIDQLDSVVLIMFGAVWTSHFNWQHFFIGLFLFSAIKVGINLILFTSGIRKEPF